MNGFLGEESGGVARYLRKGIYRHQKLRRGKLVVEFGFGAMNGLVMKNRVCLCFFFFSSSLIWYGTMKR